MKAWMGVFVLLSLFLFYLLRESKVERNTLITQSQLATGQCIARTTRLEDELSTKDQELQTMFIHGAHLVIYLQVQRDTIRELRNELLLNESEVEELRTIGLRRSRR